MGRKRTPESDARETRGKIIQSAEKLFREVGYSKTTVAEIAEDIGMSPSNIYRYFPTKAHINEEICDLVVRSIEARCVKSMDRNGAFSERIRSVVLEYHRSVRDSILKGNRLYDMIAIAMEQHWPVVQRHSDRFRNVLVELLEGGIVSGEFLAVDCQKVARTIHEAIAIFVYPPLLERWVNDFADAGQGERVDDQLNLLIDTLFHGICLRQGPRNNEI
ncbi:TetR/AcrR family transcriptional regulator [Humidesulfovibrio sp.]